MNSVSKRVHSLDQRRYDRKSSTGLPSASPPADIKSISLLYFNYLIRRILLIKIETRLYAYLTVICVGSLIADMYPFPDSYFSNKRNVINMYMVKIGWGWTLAVLLPFIVVSSSVYSLNRPLHVLRHLVRVAVATLCWYVMVSGFSAIEQITGVCQHQQQQANGTGLATPQQTKRECITAGFTWMGVDVSGHVFILLHSILTILEEARSLQDWDKLRSGAHLGELDCSGERHPISEQNCKLLHNLYDTRVAYVRVLSACIVALVFVWDIMLLATVVYFHNMPQKVTAAIVASLIWYVTYRKLYLVWPGLPGQGVVLYTRNGH